MAAFWHKKSPRNEGFSYGLIVCVVEYNTAVLVNTERGQ